LLARHHRRCRQRERVRIDIELQRDFHVLTGPKTSLRIRKLRFQEDRAAVRIDVVVYE
jgi:hypothetical protein